jgi:hypothetical protein
MKTFLAFSMLCIVGVATLGGLIAQQPRPLPKGPEIAGDVQLVRADDAKPAPKAPVKPAHGRGFILPPKNVRDAMHRISEAKYGAIRKAIPVVTTAVYDARALGVIPPVGNQGQCGDCYIWSGCKVCSSAQMVAGVVPKDGKFFLAPSYFLDCQNVGGCDGGDEYQVATIINSTGAPSLAQYGGDGQNPGNCKPTTGMTLYTVSSIIMVGPNSGIASTQDIKNYCASYGYVSVAADASTNWWNNGTGTDTDTGTSIDHAIGICGWDDTHDNGDGTKGAWIMQNNWDVTWGTNCANTANPNPTEPGGYGWVKYGASSLGTEAFVCVATPPSPPPGPPVPPVPPVPPTPPTPPTPPVPPTTNTVTTAALTYADGSTQTLVPQTPARTGVSITYTLDSAGNVTGMAVKDVTSKSASTASAPSYTWKLADGGDQVGLMCNGQQCGAYSFDLGVYRPLSGNSWGSACAAPVTPPARGFFRRR